MSDRRPYSEQRRDIRWQKKRLEIMERDGWRCVICGHGEGETGFILNVHHVVYSRHCEMWELNNDVYQTLCEGCHELRQELTDKIADAVRIAIKDVPTERLESLAQIIMARAMEELG
jgi:5-methylcytosine-specific restriction endonuclease McrA